MMKPSHRLIRLLRAVSFSIFGGLVSHGLLASTPSYELGLEYQWFPQQTVSGNGGDNSNDDNNNRHYTGSQHSYITLNWDTTFDSDRWLLELEAYAAWNQRDKNRRRVDLRSFALNYYGDNVDVKAGIAIEFWGVTESRHLVDILNQSSLADNIDEEIKLGQPMLKWQIHQSVGNLQLFWLPVFRERLFPAANSRLTPALPIDDNTNRYTSGAKKTHQDFALRYTNTLGAWDLGLAYFEGTSREPLLEPSFNAGGNLLLSPYYEQIEQSSLDLQHTGDGLLLKLEAIKRHGSRQGSYHALVTGFEFTQTRAFGSTMDLGYIAEYLYDQRDNNATTPFQDDVFLGLRLAANNIAQTSLLLGIYQDTQTSGQALRLEWDTRLRDGLVLEIEGQSFRNLAANDLLYDFRYDDYVRMTLKFYF